MNQFLVIILNIVLLFYYLLFFKNLINSVNKYSGDKPLMHLYFSELQGAQLVSSQQAAALQQQSQQQAHQQNQAQQQSQQQQQPQQAQLSYSVIPQMQTVNIDGQEALFIPSASAGQQGQPTMQFTTANGQQLQLAGQQIQLANGQTLINPHPVNLIRSPNVFPTSIIQNMQTVQLPTG